MKKVTVVSVLFVLIAGCTSSLDRVRTANRRNLLKLSVGMTKEQALAIMGNESGGGKRGEPTVNSPYKSKVLLVRAGPAGREIKFKTFEVLYYYTDIKSTVYTANPATVTDDELTPLVFNKGRLVGWGTDFLEDIKKNKSGG